MYWKAFLLILSVLVQQHMCSPVSSRNEDSEGYDDVKELESLRNENVKSNTTEKVDHLDTAAAKEVSPSAPLAPSTNPEADGEPGSDREPLANSRSAIFRHRGITQAKKSKYLADKNIPLNPGYNKYGGIQYSPTDLAAYVFSTGDEEGVAVAVEELVREGLMGRTDAINYLQDVKQFLNYYQYEQQKKLQEYKNRIYAKQQAPQRVHNLPLEQFMTILNEKREQPKAPEFPPVAAPTTEASHQIVIASTTEPKSLTHSASTTVKPKLDSSTMESFKDESIKRRLSQQVENSYEFTFEVIYRLAKDMFVQSIMKDDPVAEETLSSLVSFLESEVGNKRISREMKEKILEVVSHALVDSLREYERIMPRSQPPSIDEGSFYRHLAGLNGSPSQNGEMSEAYRKLSLGTHNDALSLPSKANRPKSS